MSDEDHREEPKLAKKSFGCRFWIFLFVLVGILAVLTMPMVIKTNTIRSDQVEALSNLRKVGLALYEFENEFGQYPDENTLASVTKKYPEHGYDLSGKSSNDLFRQLFAAGIIQSEGMFYAKIPGIQRPDGDTEPGKCLVKGEVAFAYISGLSTKGNSARIVAFAPVIPGTVRFDPKPFYGMAVFLRIDNSVTSMRIREDGRVYSEGFDIFSLEHPIWDGHAPDIRYPE